MTCTLDNILAIMAACVFLDQPVTYEGWLGSCSLAHAMEGAGVWLLPQPLTHGTALLGGLPSW